jgi:hypothetical protein
MPLDLAEAAKHVGLHPQTLRDRAKAGDIPLASKPGKKWIFEVEGLDAYKRRFSPCPYIESEKSGTLTSPMTRAEFDARLGLPTRRKPRNTTTAL